MSTNLKTEAAGTHMVPLDALHALAAAGTYVPQSKAVDLLLDLYGSGPCPAVRAEITHALSTLSRRTLVTTEELAALVATIHVAGEVESAFAHLLLAG